MVDLGSLILLMSIFGAKVAVIYMLVGVGMGAVIHNWIPEHWIETVLGSNKPF